MSNRVAVQYSRIFQDEYYEYRIITIPKEKIQNFTMPKELTEKQLQELGIDQNPGWKHYATHPFQENVIFFRQPIGTDQETGQVPENFRCHY